jgi:hypothetical protein
VPAGLVLEVAQAMRRRRERWLAYELIRFHPRAFAELTEATVVSFADDLDSWDSVDAFARTLAGPAWVRGRISDQLVDSWADSPTAGSGGRRWWRSRPLR